MKIQISMTRKEVTRTMKLIDAFSSIVEKVFCKTFKKVNSSVDSQMNPANNNVSYGIGHRAEVIYTADEMTVSIDIKEKMYDASCTFCEKVAEKAAPVIQFLMASFKMLEAFCESFKSDVAGIRNECFEELEKELEDSARYAAACINTIDGNLQIAVFKRYADSKMTDFVCDVCDGGTIAFEPNQLKAFGKKLDDSKFIFKSLNEAIYEAYEMRDRYSYSNDQCVQEEEGE